MFVRMDDGDCQGGDKGQRFGQFAGPSFSGKHVGDLCGEFCF